MSEILLNAAEARVIAVLVEKSITTPQYYPMTVNAIMLGANQKTARFPVTAYSEGEIGNALNQLEERRLVLRDSFSSRAQKWKQQFLHQMLLKPQTQALLVTLMLRGAQTLAELRANAAALGGPGDDDSVRAALDDLADRAQPLVMPLPRAPGQSAQRYAHLLCGAEAIAVPEPALSREEPTRGAALEGRVQALETRIAAQEQRIAELEQKLAVLVGP